MFQKCSLLASVGAFIVWQPVTSPADSCPSTLGQLSAKQATSLDAAPARPPVSDPRRMFSSPTGELLMLDRPFSGGPRRAWAEVDC